MPRRTPALLLLLMAAGTCIAAEGVQIPEITALKPLCLETDLVKDGRPQATIVVPPSGVYDEPAGRIVEAVEKLTGVVLPIAKDDSPAAKLPARTNVITLGNRSTNAFIGALYDRYYTLLDLRYPGPGGYVVRTLHNPFGGGFNVVFVGGSDVEGVAKAADLLIEKINGAAGEKSIRLGRLAVIELGPGINVPRGVREVETWEASAGYGSVGYFGWNSLSKRMALYYMTGDEFHAREFLRLAFPDEKAKQEIAEIDGERIEDKDHPLSGPYHYTAHMMILFWDLIEESPVFTDEDRLRVTRAFAEQLNHWAAEWVYAARSTSPPGAVGSRHGQWAAISLWCLSRYFQTYYPDPVWQRGLEGGRRHFQSLHEHAWVSGENDNLFWYNTAVAPILTYVVLTGDRVPLENGVLGTLLRGQEILASGRSPDWALNSASLGFLHKAAYLTQDGRWLEYRNRTGVDTSVFRLGQSFWPEEHLKPVPPENLVGKWTIHRLPKPKWKARGSGLAFEESFEFGSFRSRPDAGGDYLLIDGFNGASRNPYHTFAVLELRLDGYTLLKDYLNQVITRVDGLMEPKIAMDAALKRSDVIGSTAYAVAEVPGAAFANWRRTLVQRIGRYALIVDELTFRQDSANADVYFEWETERPGKRIPEQPVEIEPPAIVMFSATREDGGRRTDQGAQIVASDPLDVSGGGRRWTMRWSGPVSAGKRKTFFWLVTITPGAPEPTFSCRRIGEDAAMLMVGQQGVARVHANGEHQGRFVLATTCHAFGLSVTRIGSLLQASSPVDVDWDFQGRHLEVVASSAVQLRVALSRELGPTIDGRPLAVAGEDGGEGPAAINLSAGRHVVKRARPSNEATNALLMHIVDPPEKGGPSFQPPETREPTVPAWKPVASVQLGSAIVDLETVPAEGGPLVAAAEGNRIHLLGLDGQKKQTLATDGPIRMLRWWPETELLLAGCADEKVVAFDRSGERRWVFVSEMDPAVFRAAKTYWFKSAPGHEGIHGLATGTLLDAGSQALVGSACTLEILDENGRLLHRMPQFWGKVSTFCLVDEPDGTRNLLAARKYNGTNNVAIINSRTLNPSPRGFLAVPPGQTYMPGWSSMNRHHLFYEDLDGDGVREVISEINGTWNRVCVWTVDGKPTYAANFGPGPRIPARTMRDVDVCDLDGDGKQEIIAATSYEMVVALNCKCEKIWATRLASPAEVLACVRPKGETRAQVVLGCNDGQVRILNADGEFLRKGAVAGRPTCIERLTASNAQPVVIIGTHSGVASMLVLSE